ncbi:MAG: CBM9 family sugar-binding protein [Treponema sp.]|jgi:hypothetical protein|nr:CBM9 family sugar-binding protein [Treponema sp.]
MDKNLFLLALIIAAGFAACEDKGNPKDNPGNPDISKESCIVTFNANGGAGGQTTSVTAVSGQAMPALGAQIPTYETNSHPGDPYENNYEKKYFNGYWDAQTGGKKYYNADLSSAANWDKTADTVLYAQWLTPAEKLGVTLGGAGAAQYGWIDDFVAYYVDTPPTIDGNGRDPAWAKASWRDINYLWGYQTSPLVPPAGGANPSPAGGQIPKVDDFKGRFKVVWTAERLYVLVEIIDDVIKTPNINAAYTNPENNDCLELFISEKASSATSRGSTANFFAYHMNLNEVDVMDYVGGNNNSTDPNIRIENGFIKRNNHLNYKISKNDGTHTYIWETEMKVYDGDSYPTNSSPADKTPVTLTEGKKMGFAAAYNDNDDHVSGNLNKRNHFFGSMYVQGSTDEARNQGYRNPSVYAKLYLVK